MTAISWSVSIRLQIRYLKCVHLTLKVLVRGEDS